MTILEALKANETKAVISPTGHEYKIGDLVRDFAKGAAFSAYHITAEWTAEEPPFELWVNVYESGPAHGHITKEHADLASCRGRIRCVHMREVKS